MIISSRSTTLSLLLVIGACGLRAGDPGPQLFAEQLRSQVETLRADLQRQGRAYQVGVNPALEYSLDQLCGFKPELRPYDDRAHLAGGYLNDEPEALLDASYTGWFSTVRNQGQCGSCWAFSTTGSLESAVLKKHGAPQGRVNGDGSITPSGDITVLSTQQVLSCNPFGYGCQGGYYAWDMFMPANAGRGAGYYQGAIPAADFHYVAQRVACSFATRTSYTPVSRWGYVGSGSGVAGTDAIKAAIFNHGAVSACVYADRTFQSYTGGVFTGTDNHSSPNHAIQLVGWDDRKGAWLLKNSWGTGWGVNGFMWISYGVNSVGTMPAWVEN